jgi:hypothetical protein
MVSGRDRTDDRSAALRCFRSAAFDPPPCQGSAAHGSVDQPPSGGVLPRPLWCDLRPTGAFGPVDAAERDRERVIDVLRGAPIDHDERSHRSPPRRGRFRATTVRLCRRSRRILAATPRRAFAAPRGPILSTPRASSVGPVVRRLATLGAVILVTRWAPAAAVTRHSPPPAASRSRAPPHTRRFPASACERRATGRAIIRWRRMSAPAGFACARSRW